MSFKAFLQGFILGTDSSAILVDEIYAHCKIVPDPPEVEGGFAIVEFMSPTLEEGESKIQA